MAIFDGLKKGVKKYLDTLTEANKELFKDGAPTACSMNCADCHGCGPDEQKKRIEEQIKAE